MITLITGQPGAGKSLFTIWEVKKLAEKENRAVYYHGINDLSLEDWTLLEDPTKWHELPAGAIIVLDECQKVFRTRANGSTVPPHVAAMETHRHQGHDLFLITQHPMIIDGNIRRLCGRHVHVMRRFGAQSAVLHEWNGVRENCDKSRKDSQATTWYYPKEVFSYYKSAEVHTHKRRLPAKLFTLIFCFILMLGSIGGAIYYLADFHNPQTSEAASATASLSADSNSQSMPRGYQEQTREGRRPKTTAEFLEDNRPRIDGLPHTAPVYDDLAKAQQVPAPQACVVMGKQCKCFTDQATPIQMDPDLCQNIVKNGIFLPHLPKQGMVTTEQQRVKFEYDNQS